MTEEEAVLYEKEDGIGIITLNRSDRLNALTNDMVFEGVPDALYEADIDPEVRAIISARDIIVDEKVRWKCLYPICFGIGSSPCCPPHTPPVDECKRVIHSFRYGVVFQMDVPVKDFSFREEDFTKEDFSAEELRHNVTRHFIDNTGVCNQIEAWANSMGYRQAVSFSAGPCTGLQTGECGSVTEKRNCALLQGKTCRKYLKVRPAMEAMSIDVIGTILPLGWDMVYIGGHTNDRDDIPCASTVGLLLVA